MPAPHNAPPGTPTAMAPVPCPGLEVQGGAGRPAVWGWLRCCVGPDWGEAEYVQKRASVERRRVGCFRTPVWVRPVRVGRDAAARSARVRAATVPVRPVVGRCG